MKEYEKPVREVRPHGPGEKMAGKKNMKTGVRAEESNPSWRICIYIAKALLNY